VLRHAERATIVALRRVDAVLPRRFAQHMLIARRAKNVARLRRGRPWRLYVMREERLR